MVRTLKVGAQERKQMWSTAYVDVIQLSMNYVTGE
jgi:hypothetical protein